MKLRSININEMVVDAEMFWMNETNPCKILQVRGFGPDTENPNYKLARIKCNDRIFWAEDKELFVPE